jgi:Domain of unknown function (DUF5134)
VTGPSWLRWMAAAAFLAVAGYCVVRLVGAHRVPAAYHGCHRALDGAHLIMGIGMAVMCSPAGGPVPAAGWQTIFLLLAAGFLAIAWYGRRAEPIGWAGGGLHGVHHAVAALAMLYVMSGMPGDGAHMADPWLAGTHAPAGPPVLGWLLAGYFAAYAALLGARLPRPAARARAGPGSPLPGVLLAPRLAATCQVVMALGMGYMVAPLG